MQFYLGQYGGVVVVGTIDEQAAAKSRRDINLIVGLKSLVGPKQGVAVPAAYVLFSMTDPLTVPPTGQPSIFRRKSTNVNALIFLRRSRPSFATATFPSLPYNSFAFAIKLAM